jgi:hypothetical protein
MAFSLSTKGSPQRPELPFASKEDKKVNTAFNISTYFTKKFLSDL